MTLLTLLPLLAFIPVVIFVLGALSKGGAVSKNTWIFPALFCAAFTAWSMAAIMREGPTGFWPVHTQSLWGNQVWFDLLMALTMAWFLIVPRSKHLGMKLPIWLAFILCSGSIGFSAMLARTLFLEQASKSTASSAIMG